MRGSPEAPSSLHQPGSGAGIIAASGFCICCGISSQLQNKTAVAPTSANSSKQLRFIKWRILTRSPLGGAMRNIEILGPKLPPVPGLDLVDDAHRRKYARFMATLTKLPSSSP